MSYIREEGMCVSERESWGVEARGVEEGVCGGEGGGGEGERGKRRGERGKGKGKEKWRSMSSRVNSGVATGTTSAIGVGSGSQARHNSVMEDLHMRQIAAGRKYETLSSKLQRTMLKTEYNAK